MARLSSRIASMQNADKVVCVAVCVVGGIGKQMCDEDWMVAVRCVDRTSCGGLL